MLAGEFPMLFRGAKWTTEKILDRLTTRRVRTLELYNTSAGDDLLLELAGTGSLTALDVSSAHITDVGVQVIVRQCKLKSLMFRDAVGVTDRSMVDISGCKTLRELYLEGTSVSDDGIGHIGRLPELWSLDISRTAVTDIGLERIASDRIRLISFNDSQITGRGFSSWSVPDKFSLYTRRSQLDDEGFAVACRSFPFVESRDRRCPFDKQGLVFACGSTTAFDENQWLQNRPRRCSLDY